MNVLVIVGYMALLGQVPPDFPRIPPFDAERTSEPQWGWPKRRFELVPYCHAVHGVVAIRETWEAEGYEGTFEPVVAAAAKGMTSIPASCVQPEWRVPPEAIRAGLRLAPARLQTEPKAVDRLYCTYTAHDRNVLLTRIRTYIDPVLGLSFSLTPQESTLLQGQDLSAAERWATDFLHSVLVLDPYAPYRLELTRDAATGRVEVRGLQAFPGQVTVADGDAAAAHYRSAIAGTLDEKALTVVIYLRKYYYDPFEQVYLNPGVPAMLQPPTPIFDELVVAVRSAQKEK